MINDLFPSASTSRQIIPAPRRPGIGPHYLGTGVFPELAGLVDGLLTKSELPLAEVGGFFPLVDRLGNLRLLPNRTEPHQLRSFRQIQNSQCPFRFSKGFIPRSCHVPASQLCGISLLAIPCHRSVTLSLWFISCLSLNRIPAGDASRLI